MANTNLKESLLSICKKWNVNPKVLGLSEEIKLEAEAKLIDGTLLYSTASEFVVGSDVFTKDADGNAMPAPEGEYTMEDGTMIEVGSDGKITEMTPAGAEDMSAEELMKVIESLTQELANVSAQKAELESQIANGKDSLNKTATELSKVKAELANAKKQPAFQSVKDKKETAKVDLSKDAPKPFAQMTLKERIKHNISNINN